ncbi:MAG: glycerol-3-phosphate acyltransferase [Candidatus Cloacimonetes bacterium]|nr:glycerol-3-phosphate acyltransferase [Candidatus Cloacimonadota bacterium]
MIVIIAILIFILAYLYGSQATARLIAKGARSLNINKVGTGLADTENIYTNISKPLGILVGALDLVKAYVFLQVINFILVQVEPFMGLAHFENLYKMNMMMVYGLGMLLGHCLPLQYHFKGGRGIFTYMGFFAYFSPWPVVITAAIAWFLVVKYRQIRFAQYLSVILPPLLFQGSYFILPKILSSYHQDLPPYFVGIMFFNAIFMGVLNILVSRRLGEI